MKWNRLIIFAFSFVVLLPIVSSHSLMAQRDLTKSRAYFSGAAYGFKDSTVLFLESAGNPAFRDSAIVMNERFSFYGDISFTEQAIYVLLRTRDVSDYKFVWIEKTPVYFSARKGDFRNAVVTGSESQMIFEKLLKLQDQVWQPGTELRQKVAAGDNQAEEQLTKLEEEYQAKVRDVIAAYPKSIVSLQWVDDGKTRRGKGRTRRLYELLSDESKTSALGLRIKEYVDTDGAAAVGNRFIDFSMPLHNGGNQRLSDFSGKLLLLEFWSSYCGPCRRENPSLVQLYNQYKPKGFEIFGVSFDTNEAAWRKAIASDGLPWPNASEVNGYNNQAAFAYDVFELPTNYLIDQRGIIIAKNLRGEELRKKLKELLGE